MKVICKDNTAKRLDPKEVNNISIDNTVFPVTKGKEYIVMRK